MSIFYKDNGILRNVSKDTENINNGGGGTKLSEIYNLYQNFKSKSNIGGTDEWRNICNIANKYFDVVYNDHSSEWRLTALKLYRTYNSIITGVKHGSAINISFIVSLGDLIYLTERSNRHDPAVAYKDGYLFYYSAQPIGSIIGLL